MENSVSDILDVEHRVSDILHVENKMSVLDIYIENNYLFIYLLHTSAGYTVYRE